MTTHPSRFSQRLASVALALACGCGVPEETAAPVPPPTAPVVAPPPAASPPVALADPPPGGGWQEAGAGRAAIEDVFSASDSRFQALQAARDLAVANQSTAGRRLQERAAALGGALVVCHLPDGGAAGPLAVDRFDPPAAGFGALTDVAMVDGAVLLVVPLTAGTAVLRPPGDGTAPLTVAWEAPQSGRSKCSLVE